MSGDSQLSVHPSVVALGAVALLLAGAGATYLAMRSTAGGADQGAALERPGTGARAADDSSGSGPRAAAADAGERAGSTTGGAPLADVVVRLSEEAMDRAGIAVSPVTTQAAAAAIRIPGVVEANAYRAVTVTPLVAGRVTRVLVELGDRVRRGQAMAQIYSPELAEARTRYISLRARLEAHDRELDRTRRLVEIGAASRQELERVHAEHTAQVAEVEAARSRLELLGVPASALDKLAAGDEVSANTTVPAPIAGVVTERLANIGLNVDPAAKLFTVVDLSTVWVIGDLYEKDFSRVRVGSQASITTTAYPDRALRGRVSYIDRQVRPDTRTARVRVAVSNPRGELRLGMYADILVTATTEARVPVVPRSAIQNVADRLVVYLVNPKEPGTFIEREVRLGRPAGEQVEVVAGLRVGDVIVTEGSFFVRAERERLGLRQPGGAPPAPHGAHGGEAVQQRGSAAAGTDRDPVTDKIRQYDIRALKHSDGSTLGSRRGV
jgi:RND family efflux transporter MFP subunit